MTPPIMIIGITRRRAVLLLNSLSALEEGLIDGALVTRMKK